MIRMFRVRRGQVEQWTDWTRHVAGGAYFDWPWWKRRLADIVAPLYRRYTMTKVRLFYLYHPLPQSSFGTIPASHIASAVGSSAYSKVKPIWFRVEWVWPDGVWRKDVPPYKAREWQREHPDFKVL